MTPPAAPPRPVALVTALGSGVLTLALLALLPSLAIAGTPAPAATALGSAAWWAAAGVLILQAACLLIHPRRPRTAVLGVAALALGLGLLAPGVVYTVSHLPVIVAVYLAAPRRPWRHMLPVLVLTASAVAAGTLANALRAGLGTMPGVLGEALVQGVGVVAITTLISQAMASIRTARLAQRKEAEALSRERDALDRERVALTRAAASEERAAMARELHDIAAHHLSGIALVAAAADRQIDTDPSAAHESVRQVRTQTREVLDDIRRVVGLLRESGPAERSVEGLTTVPALVAARVEAGMDVRFEQRPAPGGGPLGEGIGPLAQLVAYRMIQESLSNAAAHAPGAPCQVILDDSSAEELEVTVLNAAVDGTGSPVDAACSGAPAGDAADPARRTRGTDGYGLLGMRERAGLVDARLEHGPTASDGWRVRLRIPRDSIGARTPAARAAVQKEDRR